MRLHVYRFANLCLLVLLPVSWCAPLMRTGLLPFWSLTDVSIRSGLNTLWHTDRILAVIVALLAVVAPYVKVITLALVHFGKAPRRVLPALHFLGRLALADVFLIAIYIVLAKGLAVGRLETAWGLYLFTGCVLVSFALSSLTRHQKRRPPRL